jgi:hypothetical protein
MKASFRDASQLGCGNSHELHSVGTIEVIMAIHSEPAALSAEVIQEYLVTVDLCLQHRKSDGGCLGYPATLLLFCVVDALGGYLALDKGNDIPKGEPFRVLNHPCFGLTLNTDQIKRLEWWYRNGLAHNAALPPGTCLTGEPGEPFEFAGNGDPVKIRVFPFHRLVERAWMAFAKTVLAPLRKMDSRRLPTMGFDPSLSLASPIASSGCPLVPKVHDM